MTKRPSKTQAQTERAKEFLERRIWDADLAELPSSTASTYGFLRMLYITATGVFRDRLPLRAAALTFTTLISIVPFLAIGLSLAKALGFKQVLEEMIYAKIPPAWPADLKEAVAGIFTQVDATNFGALGVVGLALLLAAALKVLATIEQTFNDIWGVKQNRSWARRFTDFLSALVILPILMLAATSANAFLASDGVLGLLAQWTGPLLPVYLALLKLTPFILLWIAFTAVYTFMPNTQVRFLSALAGGIVAGTSWQILQWLSIKFGVGISRYNAIYGTFAALPIFLAWLQASWLLVLFGAEVAFAHQNYRTYQVETRTGAASFAAREQLGLEVACAAAKSFLEGKGPWDPEPWASGRRFPVRLVREILQTLAAREILVAAEGTPARFLPARDPRQIMVIEILTALRDHGDPLPGQSTRTSADLLADARSGLAKALQNRSLADAAGADGKKT